MNAGHDARRTAHELRYLRGMLLERMDAARKRVSALQIARNGAVLHAAGLQSTLIDLRDALRVAHDLAERIGWTTAP